MASETAVRPGQPDDAAAGGDRTSVPTVALLPSSVVEELAARALPVVAAWGSQEAYVARYAETALRHDLVHALYVDTTHGLTLYTVYRGDRRRAAAALAALSGHAIDEAPDVPADFRLLDAARLDATPPPHTARLVFSKG